MKLKNLLSGAKREEAVEPHKTYALLGAHWYARGLYTKDAKPGTQIQANVIVSELVENSSGTKMPRTNMKVFRRLSAPILPLPEQHRIVAHLDALMPSILDHAFRGEL